MKQKKLKNLSKIILLHQKKKELDSKFNDLEKLVEKELEKIKR